MLIQSLTASVAVLHGLAERGVKLREAAHAARDQLGISESRRSEAETELEVRDVGMLTGGIYFNQHGLQFHTILV